MLPVVLTLKRRRGYEHFSVNLYEFFKCIFSSENEHIILKIFFIIYILINAECLCFRH